MINFYHLDNCPMCEMLEEMLEDRKIPYNSISDKNILYSKNIIHVPVLEVEGKIMTLAESLKWVGEQ